MIPPFGHSHDHDNLDVYTHQWIQNIHALNDNWPLPLIYLRQKPQIEIEDAYNKYKDDYNSKYYIT